MLKGLELDREGGGFKQPDTGFEGEWHGTCTKVECALLLACEAGFFVVSQPRI